MASKYKRDEGPQLNDSERLLIIERLALQLQVQRFISALVAGKASKQMSIHDFQNSQKLRLLFCNLFLSVR